MLESKVMKQKTLLTITSLILLFCASGCFHHISQQDMSPTSEPGKILVSSPIIDDEHEKQGLQKESLWNYCKSEVNSKEPVTVDITDLRPYALFERALSILEIPAEETQQAMIVWRCMDGGVYVCNSLDYPQCVDKIDMNDQPSNDMAAACEISDSKGATLPSAVTGRNTAFEWVCKDGKAEISQQVLFGDAQGYNEYIWYEVPQS